MSSVFAFRLTSYYSNLSFLIRIIAGQRYGEDSCEARAVFSRAVLRARIRDARDNGAAAAGSSPPVDLVFAIPRHCDGGPGAR